MKASEKQQIVLIGSDNLSNQMLVYSLERQLDMKCSICTHTAQLFSGETRSELTETISNGYSTLFLFDCNAKPIDEVLTEITANPFIPTQLIALYNLSSYTEAEAKALTKQVRGFFYVDDTMDLFLKGINAIFNGEVWISRQILLDYVMKNVNASTHHHRPKVELTEREQQILSLVSIGANTVETHMYNIFKKIQVSNRLQAALWAAKHL